MFVTLADAGYKQKQIAKVFDGDLPLENLEKEETGVWNGV